MGGRAGMGAGKHKTAKQTLDGGRAENTKSAQTNSTGEPEMIDFEKLTPQIVADECQRAIEECDTGVAAIVATPAGERTFENTFVALESAVDHIGQASGWYAFMAYVAEDEALRETARDWEQKLSQYAVQLGFREDLYEAVSEFAATPEALALRGEEQRLLQRTMLDYRRNGFELPKEQRARVEELKNRLVELGVQFQKAIDMWDDAIVVDRKDLAGMPDRWIEALTTVEEDGRTKYRVSLDYPEIVPFLDNAESEKWRRELFLKNQLKGGADNIKVLEEAIAVRSEIASLLGYDSWAAYVVEKRMAKNRENVERFLLDLQPKLEAKARIDMQLLSKAKQEHAGDATVNAWDWYFYTHRPLKTEDAIDDFEVANYFPLERCIERLLLLTQELPDTRSDPAPNASNWHDD